MLTPCYQLTSFIQKVRHGKLKTFSFFFLTSFRSPHDFQIYILYNIEQKKRRKTESFFIIASNFNETCLDTCRKWLFSLVIVVKVPLSCSKIS